ncbi:MULTISPECIES: hypothetical protein [Campylobacter]|uniref:hypothetical protein n=1 Tax=Campylobacter TaxID=194 RepID=UPI000A3522EF|nr:MULTISPECIES: hypothetical protein [unclassified Campylobacter]MEE3711439.1 excinuclease ABC subunit A [Campylobacter sp. CLAX-7218-21]
MKKILVSISCISALSLSAVAADDIIYLPIKPAIDEAIKQGYIDNSVKFKFGSQSGAKDQIFMKQLTTNKKANKVGKSAEESCTRAFHSALIQFFQRAKQEGGTKVVNLTGWFKKIPYDSKTNFQCGVGTLMTGVTLKGDIAK